MKDPYEFRVDAIDATCTLGFTETGEFEGDYWLKVNDTLFGELTKFIDKSVPDIAHSTIDEFKGSNILRIDFNLFLKGILKPISLEHNKRSEFATLDFAGKQIKNWHVKKLTDAFTVPFNFEAEGV